MKFISPFATCLVALLLIGLVGCAQLPNVGGEPSDTKEVEEGDSKEADVLGDSDGTDEGLAPVRQVSPNPYLANPKPIATDIQRAFDEAIVAQQSEDWAVAESLWRQISTQAPELSGPHLNLGIVLQATDRPAAAESAYLEAINVNQQNVFAYNQLGVLKRKLGEFTEAETFYLKALDVWPDYAQAHKNLGILYDLYMGRLADALKHYRAYQSLTQEEDRAVKGWVADLERRVQSMSGSDAGAS
ncbi:tetratricopeptide repeat protein [Marinibactrum halimedae]|uniref:Tetratricopeptide repeat protein n=1 Tax=Marinibactrum halimedae TaxID=1444977 RepID=A0AA37T5B7_9GAMM|nr:tetratricopeptide repeat protein [Marinibactrum halimedae]MCD9458268.1 tetratricopeptide repeat protein [Marinibactrum halimedae]GLS27105.1 hypothetical protein GCM10007877_28240 [Marinibactrum halimedae]